MKKRLFMFFIMVVLFTSGAFAQSYIQDGYLNLEGPEYWNDYCVKYTLNTDNSKGGKSKTTLVEGSNNELLGGFHYTSKDELILNNGHDNIHYKGIESPLGYYLDSSLYDLLYSLYYWYDYWNETSEELNDEDFLRIADSFDEFKLEYIEALKNTTKNFLALSEEEKKILHDYYYKSFSNIDVSYYRYVDSRAGYFQLDVYQNELDETSHFMIEDSTTVYYEQVDNDHKKDYSTLDKKVLAICSEISLNKTIIFGVLKEESLKDSKRCRFILIK